MTLTDGLRRFRLVSPLIPPGRPADHRTTATAGVWLDPRVFAGLDPADLPGLTDTERQQVQAHADRFTQLADAAKRAGGPTPDQAAEAAREFAAVRDLIDRRPWDPAAVALAGHLDRLLAAGRLPPWVLGLSVRTGPDHAGDPSTFVDLAIADAAIDDLDTYRAGVPLRRLVREVQREHLPRLAEHDLYIGYKPVGGVAEGLDDPEEE